MKTASAFQGNKRQQPSPQWLEEHRLEIENRIRNIFWTVSGDYTLSIHPDAETFVRSKAMALYDAVKQGAFALHFDRKALALYLLKKRYQGAEEVCLTELLQLCSDSAAYPLVSRERSGIDELRASAFRDFLELERLPAQASQGEKKLWKLRSFLMEDWLGLEPEGEPELVEAAKAIQGLGCANCTEEIIEVVDSLYNQWLDPDFGKQAMPLQELQAITIEELFTDHKHIALSDAEMQRVMDEYMNRLKQEMLRLKSKKQSRYRGEAPLQVEAEDEEPDPEEAEKVRAYVERSFGKSYMTRQELEQMRRTFCKGMHRQCTLYFTDGILVNPALKNTLYLRGRMQERKNEVYVRGKSLSIRHNINVLARMLERVQTMKQDDDTQRADVGQLRPNRLWKVGKSRDIKLFDANYKKDNTTFAVDILLDGSSSQNVRQPQIAAQAYIISEALSRVKIPHRVSSFCSYWDYTIIHRYRDYDEPAEANRKVLQFQAFGDNRDGLAIRTICDSLLQRREDNRILIILSDGRPNNLSYPRAGCRKPRLYVGEEAIKDTALEVRKARNAGIPVLGVFVGAEEDIYAEKRIFGRDFVYSRNISSFSHIVGTYLRRLMEQE